MRTIDYLQKVKDLTPTGSVYAAAALLDLKEGTVRNWHLGETYPDAYACTRIAELLDLDPMKVIADVEGEREKDEGRRTYWRELARKFGCWALVVGVSVTGYSERSEATKHDSSYKKMTDTVCIMSSLRRYLCRLLRPLVTTGHHPRRFGRLGEIFERGILRLV